MCFQAEPIRNSQNEYFRRNKGFAGITCFWTQGIWYCHCTLLFNASSSTTNLIIWEILKKYKKCLIKKKKLSFIFNISSLFLVKMPKKLKVFMQMACFQIRGANLRGAQIVEITMAQKIKTNNMFVNVFLPKQ